MESSKTNMSKKSDDIQTENILEDQQGAAGQPERSFRCPAGYCNTSNYWDVLQYPARQRKWVRAHV